MASSSPVFEPPNLIVEFYSRIQTDDYIVTWCAIAILADSVPFLPDPDLWDAVLNKQDPELGDQKRPDPDRDLQLWY